MIADLTKCFFKLAYLQNSVTCFAFCGLTKDVREGNVVTCRFTRHPWGVKSSAFIASFAIQKTLDDNTTGASDLTHDTSRKNIYMDDYTFSVDSLDEAKIIANEGIDLFDSRGFKFVKWSAKKMQFLFLQKLKRRC